MVKSLHVVLRTCDRTNVHKDWRVRYCGFEKPQLVVGCAQSLVNSIKNTKNFLTKLSVLDDHSSEKTVGQILDILHHSGIDYEFVPLYEHGYNNSAHQQWLMCRDTDSDLFYSVEDDYLHVPTAIQEMVESFDLFCQRLQRTDVVIYPFDEPSEYNPPTRRDFVVHGSHRHWRTGVFTTNVIMASPQLLRDHWPLFETLALKYNGDYLNPRFEHYEESNTIWNIWQQNQAIRFNPIPSLALHMQFDQQLDPYINWQQWWNDYTQP